MFCLPVVFIFVTSDNCIFAIGMKKVKKKSFQAQNSFSLFFALLVHSFFSSSVLHTRTTHQPARRFPDPSLYCLLLWGAFP